MVGWPLGKLVGTGITMRLETILSQVSVPLGQMKVQRLNGCGVSRPSDGES